MRICVNCFNDLELKQFIISNSNEKGQCDYCSEGIYSELLEVGELLDFFAEFIGIFELDENGKPLVELIQSDWNLFSGKAECHDILSDILLAINSSIPHPQECVSYIPEINENISNWEKLKEDLKWEKRFLPNIDRLTGELGWNNFFEQKVKLSESELLFRARLHYSGDQKIFEIKDMGCPEKVKAPAGRANPQGIPYLYLSKNIETTLYEIRATFLDEVSVGTFIVKEGSEIILVDFTELASAFSHEGKILKYTKSMLLKKLISFDLSKPIRRYDSELDYIPTQFICEFIRHIIDADGILFDSSLHKGGKNIVLFEQEKVQCISVEMHRIMKVDILGQKY